MSNQLSYLVSAVIAAMGAACTASGSGGMDTCSVARSLGSIQSAEAADLYTTSAGSIVSRYVIDTERGENDYLEIALFSGYGVFQLGVRPGSYELEGAETNYATCGACISVLGNAVRDEGDALVPDAYYFLTDGDLELTSIEDRLVGRLERAALVEVYFEDGSSESIPVEGGCATELADFRFDVALP